MTGKVTSLYRLADAAIDGQAGEQALVRIADLVREAVAEERIFLVHPEDKEFVLCGDSSAAEGLDTNQMGLWLVQHQCEIVGGPVAFDIVRERVSDIIDARKGGAKRFLGFQLDRDGSEMLIMKTRSNCPANADAFAYIEAATPAITLVLGRVLSVAKADRQREQMSAVADAAQLLIQAEHISPVLKHLANAISNSTGNDLVTIDVFDKESQSFVLSVLNVGPQIDTSLGDEWKQHEPTAHYPDVIVQAAMVTRQPLILPDLQTDERIPETGREFFKRAHIFSAAQLPIAFRDEFLGILRVASQRPRSYSETEVQVLNGFASQLGAALKALEMYRSLAQSEKQLREYAEELQSSMEVQHRLARTDALTGVPNRRYIDEVIRGECSRAVRHKTALCVALADLDKFKAINDNYGHKAGDAALVQLADLARRTCRRGDVVGRYGGDEFIFVLPRADLAAAQRFANRFRTAVAGRVFDFAGDGNARLKVSIGVAQLDPEKAQKPLALIKQADEALYQAKAKGGNKICSLSARKSAA
ncbi:MAG: sensor domain-containing diguanylate cyclase [Dehalococcoidia bacterium]